jgi:hypothetical protein
MECPAPGLDIRSFDVLHLLKAFNYCAISVESCHASSLTRGFRNGELAEIQKTVEENLDTLSACLSSARPECLIQHFPPG